MVQVLQDNLPGEVQLAVVGGAGCSVQWSGVVAVASSGRRQLSKDQKEGSVEQCYLLRKVYSRQRELTEQRSCGPHVSQEGQGDRLRSSIPRESRTARVSR